MSRITVIDPKQATGKAKDLIDQVKHQLGKPPNVVKMMAVAPVVLQSYLGFNAALSEGVLDRSLRERIALAVAEFDGCEYCLSAHMLLGKHAGLSEMEIAAARRSQSADPKAAIALEFVKKVLVSRGHVTDRDVISVQQAGYTDEEIVEMMGHIAINLFTNYFNTTLQTEVDYPRIRLNAQTVS